MTKKFDTRSLIVLMSAACLTTIASAQTSWWKTYGGTGSEQGYSVQQTSDGGYIVAGTATPFGVVSFDVYLVKTDASGDTLWTGTYGGAQNEMGTSVQQTTDGGYIVASFTSSFGAGDDDVYLIKTNASGDTLWTRIYGGTSGDDGNSVQQTSDGGYIVAGYTSSFGAGDRDVYLIKTNATGDTLWTRTYGGTSADDGWSVQQTSDSGYIVAGSTQSFGAGARDIYLIKTNAQGETLWTGTYGGTQDELAYSVQQTSDDGYIVAGYTMSFGAGGEDFYLVRTDALGDTLWTRTYGGTGNDRERSVQQTTDGGYIVAGRTQSFGAGNTDVYLIKTDASGDTLWTGTSGGSSADAGCSVQQTSDGGYIVAGYTMSFGAGNGDFYLIKTDSLGNVGVAEESPKPLAVGGKPSTTVVGSLPPGSVAFDATGRRVLHAKPGIYFLRTSAAAAPRKVLLVE